jgi:hypothetical protein
MLARFRRWSANRNGQPRLVFAHATSIADYQSHAAAMDAEYHRHWRLELDLSDGDVPFFTPGHSSANGMLASRLTSITPARE